MTWGLEMTSEDALAVGAMSDPDDASDFPVSGWLIRRRVFIVDETLANGPLPPVREDFDLRAMRKLDRSTLAFVVNNNGVEGTAFAVRTTGLIRVLYKLP